jgi:hypothetical protein
LNFVNQNLHSSACCVCIELNLRQASYLEPRFRSFTEERSYSV